MSDFYIFIMDFAKAHYFLFWCALWLWFPLMVCWVSIVNWVFNLAKLLFRSFNILVRGWPPEHLDADGDFNDVVDESKENKQKSSDDENMEA